MYTFQTHNRWMADLERAWKGTIGADMFDNNRTTQKLVFLFGVRFVTGVRRCIPEWILSKRTHYQVRHHRLRVYGGRVNHALCMRLHNH